MLTGPVTFSMCTSPKDLPVHRDPALDFREGQVVAVAVGGQVAVHLVGGEVVLVVGEVHLHRAGDRVQVHIAVRRGHVSPAPSPARSHRLARVDRHLAVLGTVTVRFTRPLLLLSDLTSTALPLTVSCAASESKIFFASASELA